MRSGEMFQAECRLRRASDGAFRWHLCRAVPERSPTGQILSWVGTFTDIEDQKRAQAIQAEFKGTLDAEPDAVIIFEPTNWRILYVNRRERPPRIRQGRTSSNGAGRLHGRTRWHRLPGSPGPSLDGSQPHILLETKFRRRDPLAAPIDVSVQLIRIGADRIVSIARDITERKRTQLERELLYREAVDAIRARDEFLSVASHELGPRSRRCSCRSRRCSSRRADRPRPSFPEQMKPKLEMAFKQIERLTRLIEELMDVSRITAGRLRLELEEIDLVPSSATLSAALVRKPAERIPPSRSAR